MRFNINLLFRLRLYAMAFTALAIGLPAAAFDGWHLQDATPIVGKGSGFYRIDVKAMKVTAQWPTPGCAQTNGLALDTANNRIFLGCRGSATVKPSFAVMNADTYKQTEALGT